MDGSDNMGMRQRLVMWTIPEGRGVATAVDGYLMAE